MEFFGLILKDPWHKSKYQRIIKRPRRDSKTFASNVKVQFYLFVESRYFFLFRQGSSQWWAFVRPMGYVKIQHKIKKSWRDLLDGNIVNDLVVNPSESLEILESNKFYFRIIICLYFNLFFLKIFNLILIEFNQVNE